MSAQANSLNQVTGQASVSSPLSTGGSGTFFEQHVDALFLALLLVRGFPPVLKDCQVEEVHLQNEVGGWSTDDILVIGSNGTDECRKLAIQVKRHLSITSSDKECEKTFLDFWSDFNNAELFDPLTDRLGLVVLRGTDILLDKFNGLLDCARAASDGADFASRLVKPGYLSKTSLSQAVAIKDIISAVATPSDDDFWRFLRVIHVVSFDLITASAQNEAWIKTLLTQTASGADPVAAAETTWRELLEIAGAGMPAAASYTRDSLPEAMRQRHSDVPSGDRAALRSLAEHSDTTLDGIRTTIGHTEEIGRYGLVAHSVASLDESQVLIVAGPAGSGKSAVAKKVVDSLRPDHFCLAFRAEEFAAPHIDASLSFVPISGKRLMSLLAGQGRKVILVESVERLLESSVRDAFAQLLRLAQQDGSLKVILTCRDYSVETVRTSLLDLVPVKNALLPVPPLTDEELEQVAESIPSLAVPLSSPKLKGLLRSPYFLDLATRVDWSGAEPLPNDEREFRDRCWKEVIRRNADAGGAMPRRRDKAFVELSLRRARELRPYVRTADMDMEAFDALRRDGLVTAQEDADTLAAPSHDVLEDWAILHWLDVSFLECEGSAGTIAGEIGGHPAIRRSYRKWLGEMLVRDPEKARPFILSVFQSETLPAYFRDDSLIAVLLSPDAETFLIDQSAMLMADNAKHFLRLIHILRVACKKPPDWLPQGGDGGISFLVPKGAAWAPVLALILESVNQLLPSNLELVLGFVEDWASAVGLSVPDPPGFHDAGKITFRLLGRMGGYGADELRKRVFAVLAKIPKADEEAFQELLERGCRDRREEYVAYEFAEFLLTGISGWFACRDFPSQMIQLAHAHFCLTDADLADWHRRSSSVGVDLFFGMREHTGFSFFPASGIRGPFPSLLRFHPREGLDFIISLFNHAGSWYGEHKWPGFRLESAGQIDIVMPDGEITRQWANMRWWQLYRGTSVAPHVLESAAMALEAWLLSACKLEGVDVEWWLLKIMRESNNVGLTAVVASVCVAYPDKGGLAALTLLGSQDVIEMDRARLVSDGGHASMSDLFPFSPVDQKVYETERKASDEFQHRRNHLETLAVQLQSGQWREGMWRILDGHRDALPPQDKQDERQRLWRLALHRMDLRGYRIVETVSAVNEVVAVTGTDAENTVLLGPGMVEDDIHAMIDSGAAERAGFEADIALLNWGFAMWARDRDYAHDPSEWPEKLVAAKERDLVQVSREYARGGPGFIAAVCVRDHWDVMEPQDRSWCASKLMDEIGRNSDSHIEMTRIARGSIFPDRAAAYVLPRVLSDCQDDEFGPFSLEATAKALTHTVDEVVHYAAGGIGFYLQGGRSDLALRFIGAAARLGNSMSVLAKEQEGKPYDERLSWDEISGIVTPDIRARICSGDIDTETELVGLDPNDRAGHSAVRIILGILKNQEPTAASKAFLLRIARYLVGEWEKERASRDFGDRLHYEFEFECLRSIARLALRLPLAEAINLCAPFLSVMDLHRKKIGEFVKALVYTEDELTGSTSFWGMWQAFADRFCESSMIRDLDRERSDTLELPKALFLDIYWNAGVRHWPHLEGNAYRIDALLKRIPASAHALEAYCTFLLGVGGQSLPQGFVVVSQYLQERGNVDMLSRKNTVLSLEMLLRGYVYGEPLRLKSSPDLRQAVLLILDELVEAGSSPSFQMRDDFVTPVSAN